MKIGLFAITIAFIASGLAACSYLKPSCDSPGVIENVKALLGGPVDNYSPAWGWLKDTVQLNVLNEKADDSGRHITCTATVSIPTKAFANAPKLVAVVAGLAEAGGNPLGQATIHYNMNMAAGSFLDFPTIALTPVNKLEEERLQLIHMALRSVIETQGIAQSGPERGNLAAESGSAPAKPVPTSNNNAELAVQPSVTPDLLGMTKEYLEKHFGPAKHQATPTLADYTIGKCDVLVWFGEDRTIKSFSVDTSDACAFNLKAFINETGTAMSNTLTLGQVADLLGSDPTWDCISECGTQGDSSFMVLGGGGSVHNGVEVEASTAVNFQLPGIQSWIASVKADCDPSTQKALSRLIKDQKVQRITVGYNVREESNAACSD